MSGLTGFNLKKGVILDDEILLFIRKLPQYNKLSKEAVDALQIVGSTPFRVNNYVTENLIDWSAQSDPIYKLTLTDKGMLSKTSLKECSK